MTEQDSNQIPLCGKPLPKGCVCGLQANHDGDCGKSLVFVNKERATWIGAPAFFNLNIACRMINDAFGDGGFGCYLVGSSLVHRNFRDVDVRYIMSDEKFDKLFGYGSHENNVTYNAFWSLMCTSIALWLSQQTGLPIDFQIQRQTNANESHKGMRNPLGLFLDYPGERPSDLKPPQ